MSEAFKYIITITHDRALHIHFSLFLDIDSNRTNRVFLGDLCLTRDAFKDFMKKLNAEME